MNRAATAVAVAALAVLWVSAGTAAGESCYPLQSGVVVDNRSDIPLEVCHPIGTTANCDHCTHAGSKTACWQLVSRCLSDTLLGSYKLENWGYKVTAGEQSSVEWMRNHDEKGNVLVTSIVCKDRFGGNCFYEVEALSSGAHRPLAVLAAIAFLAFHL